MFADPATRQLWPKFVSLQPSATPHIVRLEEVLDCDIGPLADSSGFPTGHHTELVRGWVCSRCARPSPPSQGVIMITGRGHQLASRIERVVDVAGEPVGFVADVHIDRTTQRPTSVAISTGLTGSPPQCHRYGGVVARREVLIAVDRHTVLTAPQSTSSSWSNRPMPSS